MLVGSSRSWLSGAVTPHHSATSQCVNNTLSPLLLRFDSPSQAHALSTVECQASRMSLTLQHSSRHDTQPTQWRGPVLAGAGDDVLGLIHLERPGVAAGMSLDILFPRLLQTQALGKAGGGRAGGYRRHMVKSTSLGLRVIDTVAFRRDQGDRCRQRRGLAAGNDDGRLNVSGTLG